ncbi:MAG TPA: stalk domain-containing protein, partial [Bacilli bacterium]
MKTIWNNIQRRDLIIFLCILSVVTFSPLPTANAEQAPVSIIIDTVKQNYIQQPFIVDGTTMVPMSAIFRTLGAAVIWDSSTKTVTATKG